MNSQTDAAGQQCLVDFLGEQALAAGLGQRPILDGIAGLETVDGQTVTVSAGVARFPQDGDDAEAVLAAARAWLSWVAQCQSSKVVAEGRCRARPRASLSLPSCAFW